MNDINFPQNIELVILHCVRYDNLFMLKGLNVNWHAISPYIFADCKGEILKYLYCKNIDWNTVIDEMFRNLNIEGCRYLHQQNSEYFPTPGALIEVINAEHLEGLNFYLQHRKFECMDKIAIKHIPFLIRHLKLEHIVVHPNAHIYPIYYYFLIPNLQTVIPHVNTCYIPEHLLHLVPSSNLHLCIATKDKKKKEYKPSFNVESCKYALKHNLPDLAAYLMKPIEYRSSDFMHEVGIDRSHKVLQQCMEYDINNLPLDYKPTKSDHDFYAEFFLINDPLCHLKFVTLFKEFL